MLKLVWATDIDLNFVSVATAAAWCRSVEQLRRGRADQRRYRRGSPTLLAGLRFLEDRISAPIYFVAGNHDYYRSSFAPFAQTWPTSRPRQIGSAGSTRWTWCP